jgi:hypothetical protein
MLEGVIDARAKGKKIEAKLRVAVHRTLDEVKGKTARDSKATVDTL